MFLSRGNYDVLRDLFVDWRYDVVLPSIVKDADYAGMSAIEHATDLAFGASVGANRADVDQHPVAMHGISDCMRTDVDVALNARTNLVAFGDNKSVAVAMHGEASDRLIPAGDGTRKLIAAVGFPQLAGFYQVV